MDKKTPTASESLAEQFQTLNQDWINGWLLMTRSLADGAMTPRQRFDAGRAAMEKLTRDVLALEVEWVRAMERSTPPGDGGDAADMLAMSNHLLCEMVIEGIRVREQLWDTAFRELQNAEKLIPDTNGLADTGADTWQELFTGWIGEGPKPRKRK